MKSRGEPKKSQSQTWKAEANKKITKSKMKRQGEQNNHEVKNEKARRTKKSRSQKWKVEVTKKNPIQVMKIIAFSRFQQIKKMTSTFLHKTNKN